MAIDLELFASGDTDYIAKLNANMSLLEQAISVLQAQADASAPGSALSSGYFLSVLFNNSDGLIGVDSYKPTGSGSTLTVAAGGMYLAATSAVVQFFSSVNLSFAGQTSATYYVVIDSTGMPTRNSVIAAGAVYSVVWNGASFGTITRLVPAYYDAVEADGSRVSTALGHPYHMLDDRLEAGEAQIAGAITTANAANTKADAALAEVTDLRADIGAAAVFSIRKVGCTVDGTVGVKGTIQVDFQGTIIGWSCIADAVGSLSVDVWKAGSSVPPAVPAIPVAGGKITASAPIALSSAQSAARGTVGVSTWNTVVTLWDVFSFSVASVSGITRATLYFRVQEMPPPTGVTGGTIASTVNVTTMGPSLITGGAIVTTRSVKSGRSRGGRI